MQEDVFERAKNAKEKAAREAMEARGLVPKSRTVNATSVAAATSTSLPTTNNVAPAPASSSEPITPDAETDPNPADKGSGLGVSNED